MTHNTEYYTDNFFADGIWGSTGEGHSFGQCNYLIISGSIISCLLQEQFKVVMQFQVPQHKHILLHSLISNDI